MSLISFQGFARLLVVCHWIFPALLTVSILTSCPADRTLDACLGNYEEHFVKSSGYQVCTEGRAKLVLEFTRKYPLRGYILGVLTHTTTLDRLGR